jgi:hypothetical protein
LNALFSICIIKILSLIGALERILLLLLHISWTWQLRHRLVVCTHILKVSLVFNHVLFWNILAINLLATTGLFLTVFLAMAQRIAQTDLKLLLLLIIGTIFGLEVRTLHRIVP